MEHNWGEILKVEVCEKCYQHKTYAFHSQQSYQETFHQLASALNQIGIAVVRNAPPKYLKKTKHTKTSTKRYIDSNTNKIVEFPAVGSFELFYKNILIYSKIQTSTFPDVEYVVSILKIFKQLYEANHSILNGFERFREVEYEWKKSKNVCESLYCFIKMNSYGNNSEESIRGILFKEIQNWSLDINKKRVIHPYVIYQSKEKKQKIQSIYSPKSNIIENLTKLATQNIFTSRNFNRTKIKPKPKQNQNEVWGQKNKTLPKQTSRSSGSIVKNWKKNSIFELVIQDGMEGNVDVDNKKLREGIKGQNLAIQNEFGYRLIRRQNIKSHSKGKSQQLALSASKKQKNFIKINRNQKLYIPHGGQLSAKTGRNQSAKVRESCNINIKFSKIKRNSKGSSKTISDRMKDQNQGIDDVNFLRTWQEGVGNSSSALGSIKRNMKCNEHDDDFEIGNSAIKSEHQFDDNTLKKLKCEACDSLSISRISKENVERNKSNIYGSNRISCEQIEPIVNNEKQQIRRGSSRIIENSVVHDQNNKTFSRISNFSKMSQNLSRSSRIEQQTVQKRISERKRSTLHERHPNTSRMSQFYSQHTEENSVQQNKNSQFIEQVSNISEEEAEQNIEEEQNACIEQLWEQIKQNKPLSKEPAQIRKKFVQPTNFYPPVFNEAELENIFRDPFHAEVGFQVKGEELPKQFVMKSIRSICKPNEINLFPQIFKQIDIEMKLPQQSNDNQFETNFDYENTQKLRKTRTANFEKLNNRNFFLSKFIHIANLMLRSNPITITRLFQNKKYVNPYGVYCVWLRNLNGRFQPVFINDQFPFEESTDHQEGEENQRKYFKSIYSGLSEGSLWLMLLQKAVAKILGGYHCINQASMADLMSILMGSPTVDFGDITLQKAVKLFDQKILFNKMAGIYTLRQNSQSQFGCTSLREGSRIDRVIGFNYDKKDNIQSAVTLKMDGSSIVMSMSKFLANYGQICLLFFNNNYFLNQVALPSIERQKSIISCRFVSGHSKNTCYLMFSNLPQKYSTKVTLYRQLLDSEADFNEGMNPLNEENLRYEYVGEICKTGKFFFEAQLKASDYICILQSVYEKEPTVSIFSEYPIEIKQKNQSVIKSNPIQKSVLQNTSNMKSEQKSQLTSIANKTVREVPQILIQDKSQNAFYDEKVFKKLVKQKSNLSHQIKSKTTKTSKQYAYFYDNVVDSDDMGNKEMEQSLCDMEVKDGQKIKSQMKVGNIR